MLRAAEKISLETPDGTFHSDAPLVIDFQITSHRFPQTLNADRGQLRQRLPELVSPGCFAHLRGAPSELFRPRTQVAFPSLDPVPLLSQTSPSLMSHRSVPPAHESGRDHSAARARRCARSDAPAPRSFAASLFLVLAFHE